ncbi:MAG TPA: hypothetical protein VK753_01160 [Xanthomonadaceae bacterium]|jgi:hypothetical protein|nr:hypothetical protein [Xanthomonadaceae bacterium]
MSLPRVAMALLALACAAAILPVGAQDDARTKQLRLLCAQLSGDLSDPGGIAAFRRCLTAKDPLNEIRKDNNIGHVPRPLDRPNAVAPVGFGRNSRKPLAAGVAQFYTADGKVFFVIDKDARLWRGSANGKDVKQIDQGVRTVVLATDSLLVLDLKGALWREGDTAASRVQIGRDVAGFQPMDNGLLYVRGSDGTLWREGADGSKRVTVDRTVAGFQAVDASIVFVLGNDHKLWREVGDMRTRTQVASNIAAFQYVPDGDTMYVLTPDGGLWRQEGKDKPVAVDTSVAAFVAVDMHLAYVLGKDGRLWQELGGRDQAVLVDQDLLVQPGKPSFQAMDPQHVYVLGADRRLWAERMPAGR